MGRISVSSLHPGPGVVLERAVTNHRGERLADAGAVVDAGLVRVLQTWGVTEVDVLGASEPTLEEIELRMAAQVETRRLSEQIDSRFAGASGHDFLLALRRIAKKLALETHGG